MRGDGFRSLVCKDKFHLQCQERTHIFVGLIAIHGRCPWLIRSGLFKYGSQILSKNDLWKVREAFLKAWQRIRSFLAEPISMAILKPFAKPFVSEVLH
jgi:hypothetical protein